MKNEFKLKFNLPQNGFLEPVDLQDTQVGFSVYKERETKGFKSLFRVYIRNEDIEKGKSKAEQPVVKHDGAGDCHPLINVVQRV